MRSKIKVVTSFFDRCAGVVAIRPLVFLIKAQNRFDALVVAQLTKVMLWVKAVGEWCKSIGDSSGRKFMENVSHTFIKLALKVSLLALKFAFRRLARHERLCEMESRHG